ncbi:hypothetical protein ACTZWW_16985 [Salinarimonas sp. NSM]|uniref:hypothetical protein n=1 Tax=Salinarimonas sp. NSM TaxID=3458003 RepID=UPI00403632B9
MQTTSPALVAADRPLPLGLDKTLLYPALALAACLLVELRRAPLLLADPDTQWHVTIGQHILATGTWPRADLWSHTFIGEPWIAKEWLSQILLGGAHLAAGWPGVAFLASLAIAIKVSWLLAFLMRRLEPRVALLAFLACAFLVLHGSLARPHILAHLLMIGWLVGVTQAVERGRAPPLALALLMIPWANMHASFPLAIGLAGLLGVEALARAPAAGRLRLAVSWAGFGLLAVACTTLTPYGATPLLVAISVFEAREAVLYIGEWQPLEPFGAHWFVLPAVAGAALAVGAIGRRDPRAGLVRGAIVLLCGYMALQHQRFVPDFAIVTLVVLADPLARLWPRLAAPPRSAPTRAARLAVGGVLAAALVAALLLPRASMAPHPRVTPLAALETARAAGIAGTPVLNDYILGGFLIREGVPTFIDGRSDQLFLGGFMHESMGVLEAPDATAVTAMADRWDVGWALTATDTLLDRQLAGAAGWREIHRDGDAAVFVREGR